MQVARTRRFCVVDAPSPTPTPSPSPGDGDGAADALFDRVFAEGGEAAHRASAQERALTPGNRNLLYGELPCPGPLRALFRVLRGLGLEPGGLFVDLGSGAGRPCVAAALLHPFAACEGLELLTGLHAQSLEAARRCRELLPGLATELRFVRASFLEHDWSHASVVFANSTCFDADTMQGIAVAATRLGPGSFVITLTHALPPLAGLNLVLVHEQRFPMDW